MNLADIIGVMRQHSTPFDFSEIAEEVIVNYARAEFSNEAQVKIERAVARELMRLSRSQNFNRQKSRRNYAKYRAEYYSCFHFDYSEINKKSIEDKLIESRIVYVGDFHPLKSPKTVLLNLLKRIVHEMPVVLALECLPQKHQFYVDKFMRGECSQIPFDKSWYSPMELYGGLINFAKESSGKI